MKKHILTKYIREILSEIQLFHYKGLIRVKHSTDLTMTEIGDRIRALPEVTIVTNVSHDEQTGVAVYSVKLLSSKSGAEAYNKLKHIAVTTFPDIKKVDIGTKTIERIE
jgi:hypothetical protein